MLDIINNNVLMAKLALTFLATVTCLCLIELAGKSIKQRAKAWALLIILAGICALHSNMSKADEIYIGAWSHHFSDYPNKVEQEKPFVCPQHRTNCAKPASVVKKQPEYNETNNLIAYEHNGYVVGYFKNSFNDDAAIVGKRFELFEYNYIKSGLYVGFDYGYKGCDKNDRGSKKSVCLEVVPMIEYTKYDAHPTLLMLGDALTFSVKWELK